FLGEGQDAAPGVEDGGGDAIPEGVELLEETCFSRSLAALQDPSLVRHLSVGSGHETRDYSVAAIASACSSSMSNAVALSAPVHQIDVVKIALRMNSGERQMV